MGLEQIVIECQKNSPVAQEQLYRLLASKIFGVCLKYSRSRDEAEDNLQDGFILIFEKIHKFEFKGSFEGWAKRVVINYILQKYRTEGVFEILHENVPDVPVVDVEEDSLSMDYLVSLIQQLPDRYRLVFNLYVIDDYSHKEIAEMLNINIGTSKSNLARARMILKEKIESQQASNKIKSAK
ncbi:sigma-70 family RNA polymerase sigma factor [Flavobacterium enshiense]|uniref:RNA polymerase sigma factor n=1 Tax=Flavobacterium enshiense TaxID=1341165 RepID=UPI00345D8C27